MDFPLHQHYTDRHQDNTPSSNNFSSYQVFNDRSTNLYEEENSRSSNMILLSTRSPQGLNHSWNQPLHTTYNPSNVQQPQIQNMPHSERGIAGFVQKLYQCLQTVENNQIYARWCQHDGKDMFIINCIPDFTKHILPQFFKHCKFQSFVRQLNIYGFQRDTDARKSKDTKDKESCRWYHQYFRPGRRDLFHLIRRKATRYSRKKHVKASMENEDPETILPLGSGDESELDDDDQNMILLVNNEDDHERRLSSASSVTQSMHPIDYTSAPSQLQLGFHEPETNTANSPIHHLSIHQDNTPTITDLTSDNADPTMNVSMHRHHHHHHQEPLMHDESEYQKMQRELSLAQFTISKLQLSNQQLQARNQQLEEALGLTKSVKPSTIQQPGGYMSSVCTTMPNNNYLQLNHQNSSPRLVTNHRSMFEMQQPKPPLNTPRPNYNNNGFYFHQQNDIKQEDSTWFNHHHRDSLSAAAVDSASVMPTTESNTATENIVKAERLKTASPLTVHNNTNNRHATVNNDTTRNNKLDLNGHMHFDNNYM